MTKVTVTTTKGALEVEALHVWTQSILGAQFSFALHPAGVVARGFDVPLAISELSTGFDTKAVMLHPKNRTVLSINAIKGMPRAELKSRARAALHNLLKRVGEDRFVKAALGARIQVEMARASAGEESASIFMPGTARMSEPATATISGTIEATERNEKLLDQLFNSCEVCDGSKVVSTTEKDHEGNNVEAACPACIPKSVGFNANLDVTQAEAEEPDEEIAAAKAAGKCGECHACYAGYHEQCKGKDFDWGKELGADEAQADAATMNDNMAKYGTIDVPKLEQLKKRRDELQDRYNQHGTMTGDTTEQDIDDLATDIAEIEEQITALEANP